MAETVGVHSDNIEWHQLTDLAPISDVIWIFQNKKIIIIQNFETFSSIKGASEVTWSRSMAQKIAETCGNIKWGLASCSNSLVEKY